MKLLERVGKFKAIDLYPVTCQELSEGRTNLQVLDAVLAGGGRIIQLREKQWNKKAVYEMALEFRKRTKKANALLIINDHVDVALAVGADGVHLGQEDLPIAAARSIAPDLILGKSTHSLEQALQAEKDGADYINIGPIFPTQTKEGVTRGLGPEAIRAIHPNIRVPFTTMGGIKLENIDQVLEAGARRVALITGVTQARDITERVRELRRLIRAYG